MPKNERMDMEIAELDHAIHSFLAFARSLPAQAMEPSKTVRWGPREVLIHLVFWHEQYCGSAAAVAASQSPVLRKGTIEEINRIAVAENRFASVEELTKRWLEAQRILSELARSHADDGLQFPIRVKSKVWPLSDLARIAAGHIRKHELKLRNLL
jgi:hypothetical protein